MKKLFKGLIASLLVVTLLVACGGSGSGATVKLGVASTQGVAAGREDSAEYSTVVVGVALKDDKVAYVSIDESQQFAKIVDGVAVIDQLKTKKERGSDYGMLEASTAAGLGKEWNDQIAGVEEALIGKTLDEVKAYFAGDDVKTAATIILENISATVVKAIEGAVEVTGVAKVGLGYSVATTVKQDGVKPESVVDYAMIAVDKDGKIVKALLDNAQEKATVTDAGFTFDNIGKSKGELKEDYNMLGASPIKKEWYEQNDALMALLEGQTVEEFLALDADGTVNESTKTSVTMVIAGSQAAVKHASDNLKEVK